MKVLKDPDAYRTLSTSGMGIFKDRGSKFIGYAYHVRNKEEIKEKLELLKAEHLKSRHVCYAYNLGPEADDYRANDDGEPSGSAGTPIHNQLRSQELTDSLVAVVRYFGGTKLGVPGLINAYKTGAKLAIDEATIVTRYVSHEFDIRFDYSLMGSLMNHMKQLGIQIISKSLNEHPSLRVMIRRSTSDEQLRLLKAKLLGIELERITEKTNIPGIKITKL